MTAAEPRNVAVQLAPNPKFETETRMHLLFLILATMATGDLRPMDNALTNPSFELDLNRDLLPDGWTPDAFRSNGKLVWDDSASRSGKASLRIDDPGNRTDGEWKDNIARWVSQPRPVNAETQYKLEAWVKTQGVQGISRVVLAWQNGHQWISEDATESVSGTSDWKRISLTATAPENATEVRVLFEVGYGNGTAWLDDIVLAGHSSELVKAEYSFHDTSDWFPFSFPLNDVNRDSVDLSHFLDAPAGKHGFVTSKPDGHFYFADGSRARFFGVNMDGAKCMPEKAEADLVASRLAKYGVNMVRLHSLDSTYALLVDYSQGISQNLHPDALQRLDYFIAALKRQGIYIYLDLLDYRKFSDADGVKHADVFTDNWAGSSKGASLFDPRMIELQKEYATKLLTHVNVYTKLRYADDPAIALIEMTNENSTFYFVLNQEHSSQHYREVLTRRWNQWLVDKYKNHGRLSDAWKPTTGRHELEPEENLDQGTILLGQGQLTYFSRGSMPDPADHQMGPMRMRDFLAFLAQLQTDYQQQMRSHLTETVGVKVPITGTNQCMTVCDTRVVAALSDFTSGNQYWFHPHLTNKPFMKFANTARVASDFARLRGPMTVLSRNTVAGKPMIATEFNFPWPNEYRCEGLLLGTAYACLQDWDGLLLFEYDSREKRLKDFKGQSDPATWGNWPAAATMFHRHDVATAKNEVHVVHTREGRAVLQPDERTAPFTTFRYLAFLSKVRNAFPDVAYDENAELVLAAAPSDDALVVETTPVIRFGTSPWKEWQYPAFARKANQLGIEGYDHIDSKIAERPTQLISDTGELVSDYGSGLMTIDTERTQAIVGFLGKAKNMTLSKLSLTDCETEFAAVTATSLDGLPIGDSRRVLVTVVGRAENTAQAFWSEPTNPKSWTPEYSWMLSAPGRLPVITEPVKTTITIACHGTGTIHIHALDATGKRVSDVNHDRVTASDGTAAVSFSPMGAKSIWFEFFQQ